MPSSNAASSSPSSCRSPSSPPRLTAVYQPIICTHSNRLHGAELLCRWPHPEFGMISPDEFIPLAEELGLIGQLGQLMLELGCAQLARWQVAAPDLVLSINLSPLQFRDPRALPADLRLRIERHGLALAAGLEITEGVLMENADEIESNLASLIEGGLPSPSMTSAPATAPLAYLPRLRVATLKLDRSFAQGLGHQPGHHRHGALRHRSGPRARHQKSPPKGGRRRSSRPGWRAGRLRSAAGLPVQPPPAPADFARNYQLPA